jgi:hypothetical protein
MMRGLRNLKVLSQTPRALGFAAFVVVFAITLSAVHIMSPECVI